jgi:hypothetical protein
MIVVSADTNKNTSYIQCEVFSYFIFDCQFVYFFGLCFNACLMAS